MADNLIQVGAKFDGAQLQTGMREATAAVADGASAMKSQFSEVADAAKKAGDVISSFAKYIDGLKDAVLETSHLSEA
ncbi:MAG TPA: hypothetical protein VJ723_12740, partial [Candidatus Angelobacter sp.]|nr:hypothetical protein [Candidatus Angelobacter sp.]